MASTGTRRGDELIIGAVQCLTETFGPEASCVRGGRRILRRHFGPQGPKDQLAGKPSKAVERYNQGRRIRVLLAVGSSMLLDKNGQVKNLSDWKQEADLQMCEEKKKMKQRMPQRGGKCSGL